jgi:hypothetical protein
MFLLFLQNSSPSLVIQIKWKQKAQNIWAAHQVSLFSFSLAAEMCQKEKPARSISLSSTDWYSAQRSFWRRPWRSLLVHSFESEESSENTHTLCAGVLAKCAHRHACREPVRSILITSSGDRHRAESFFCANTSLFARRAISRHSLFTRRRGGKAAVNCSCDSRTFFG